MLRDEKKVRSHDQNAYYWGVVLKLICDFTGDMPEDMHNALGIKFLKKITKSGLETRRSTADLETMEFEEYLSQIRAWSSIPADQGGLAVFIPLPNEVDYSEYL